MTKVVELAPKLLRPHALHGKIYGDGADDALIASVREGGILTPLLAAPNGRSYRLISGSRRRDAAIKIGLPVVPVRVMTFANDAAERIALIEANRQRIKTLLQTKAEGLEVERIEAARAAERQQAAGARGDEGGRGKKKPPGTGGPKGLRDETARTRERVAASIGLGSGKTWERLKAVPDAALKAAERDLGATVGTLYRQAATVKREKGRQIKRVEDAAQVRAATPLEELPADTFATIVADPPWDWGDEGDSDQMGRARPTYATMPIEEVTALPVARIAATNAHLYLWITNRSLPKGFALLEAWGFRYVTCLTWCKPSIGMGNYYRGSTEQVLFGVRGSLPLARKNVGTWFAAARPGRHSGKPERFYALVKSCSPGPRLDLFARGPRKGWTVWGADVRI